MLAINPSYKKRADICRSRRLAAPSCHLHTVYWTDLAVFIGRTTLSDGDLGEVVQTRRVVNVELTLVDLVTLVTPQIGARG